MVDLTHFTQLIIAVSLFVVSLIYVGQCVVKVAPILYFCEVHALPIIQSHNRILEYNTIRHTVIPVWRSWIQEMYGFSNTILWSFVLTLLLSALIILKGSIVWGFTGISVLLLSTSYSLWVVYRRCQIMQFAGDLLHTSIVVLLSGESQVPDESKRQILAMLADDNIWRLMISGTTTRSIKIGKD